MGLGTERIRRHAARFPERFANHVDTITRLAARRRIGDPMSSDRTFGVTPAVAGPRPPAPRHRGMWLPALIFAWHAGGGPVAAQDAISVSEATTMLASVDVDEIQMGIEALGVSGAAAAVPPLAARIRRGLPPPLLDAALDTLAVLGRSEAGPILVDLARHRRADVRLKAIEALVGCRPRQASEALQRALNDSDGRVRGAAAAGLGALAARDAIERLFAALDRGVLEATPAIGRLANPRDVMRLLGYVTRLPFEAMTPGLAEILSRGDLPARTRLDVVAQLEELATPEVRTFFEEILGSLDSNRQNAALRRALEAATTRIAN